MARKYIGKTNSGLLGPFIIITYATMEVLPFPKRAIKRRGIAYKLAIVLQCHFVPKTAKHMTRGSRLFDILFSWLLFFVSFHVVCATLLNCIRRKKKKKTGNHLKRLSFLFVSVSLHVEMPPKKLGLIVCINKYAISLFYFTHSLGI
jgi:hypothetical protein